MVQRREHFGGANIPTLAAGFNAGDPTFQTSPVVNWGTGAGGPYWVRVGKGLPNEEKLLIVSRSGTTFTIAAHGDDGTSPQDHSPGESVEHIGTATELDEANAHIMATDGVHGLPSGHKVVGDQTVQTLKSKTIDGSLNTLLNIPRTASPQIDSKLTALDTKDAAQDTAITAETASRSAGDAANATAITAEQTRALAAEGTEATTRAAADTANASAITAETTARTAADALKAPIASPVFTGTVTLPADAAAALQAVTKQQFDVAVATLTDKAGVGGVFTGAPDANGNIVIPHGLGVTPGHEVFAAVGPSTNGTWVGIFTCNLRVKDATNLTCHVFHTTDGTPVGSGSVTVSWHAWK